MPQESCSWEPLKIHKKTSMTNCKKNFTMGAFLWILQSFTGLLFSLLSLSLCLSLCLSLPLSLSLSFSVFLSFSLSVSLFLSRSLPPSLSVSLFLSLSLSPLSLSEQVYFSLMTVFSYQNGSFFVTFLTESSIFFILNVFRRVFHNHVYSLNKIEN